MENQNEIMKVEQDSKKGIFKKLAVVGLGVAAGVGAVMFWRKRKLAKLENEEVEISEDSINESTEN